MDSLQFVSSLIGSLAWPTVILLIALLFRRALFRLIPRLRRVSYGDVAAEFGDKLQEAEKEVAELPSPKLPSVTFRDEAKQLEYDQFSNNSIVFVDWLKVESAILNLARKANLLKPNMPASQAAYLLLNRGIIDPPTYQAIRDLLELRNIAVHPSEIRLITAEEADRFKKLAEKVAAVLEGRQ